MMNCFEENLKILAEENAELARLVDTAGCDGLSWCETRRGEANLCHEGDDRRWFYHSNYDACRETAQWLGDIPLDALHVLYVYGIGVGYSFDVLKGWLAKRRDRYLVYLEDDLQVLHRLLETARGGEMVSHRQVMLAYLGDNENDCDALCEELAYHFVKLPMKIVALPAYARVREDRLTYLQMRLMHRTVHVNFASEEFLEYGRAFFTNFYKNLFYLPTSHAASKLFGKFNNIPAIICGAGPSLNKNFSVLKTLERRALIFAGGSAINALTGRGLWPHFGATVDPNPEQHKRMVSQTGYELPFFYKGRTYASALETLHGPRIYLTEYVGYPISTWVEKELGIQGTSATEGFNVLHLTIDLARLMGCNPIIFVGMDLAYTDMQLYASSVVAQPKVSEEDLTKATDLNNNSFLRHDIHGKPVYTLWKWIAESHYTSQYAKQFPEKTFINATEGGLGAEGIPNKSLREVAESYLSTEYDLKNWIHQELQQAIFVDVDENKIRKILESIKASLETSLEQCHNLVKSFDALKEAVIDKKVQQIEHWSSEVENLQQQLEEEIAYRHILQPVNHIRSVAFERHFQEIEGDDDSSSEKEQIVEHYEAMHAEALSLQEAAKINLTILNRSLE